MSKPGEKGNALEESEGNAFEKALPSIKVRSEQVIDETLNHILENKAACMNCGPPLFYTGPYAIEIVSIHTAEYAAR